MAVAVATPLETTQYDSTEALVEVGEIRDVVDSIKEVLTRAGSIRVAPVLLTKEDAEASTSEEDSVSRMVASDEDEDVGRMTTIKAVSPLADHVAEVPEVAFKGAIKIDEMMSEDLKSRPLYNSVLRLC